MAGAPLQFGIGSGYVAYLVQLSLTLLAMLLALFIVFQAYRGARRNRSGRMLFLAAGLALLTVVPFAISLVATAAGQRLGLGVALYTVWLPIATRIVELCGLGSILYSLTLDS